MFVLLVKPFGGWLKSVIKFELRDRVPVLVLLVSEELCKLYGTQCPHNICNKGTDENATVN